MKRGIVSLVVLAIVSLVNSVMAAETITVVSFNVESDTIEDTDPSKVAADMRSVRSVDLWGLSEVSGDPAAVTFLRAARRAGQGKFRYILSRSGRSDRVAIIYNRDRLELRETQELHDLRYRLDGSFSVRMRGQLAARFRIKNTGDEFFFAVNHLKCCGNGVAWRKKQIGFIKKWAGALSVPAIIVGDFNTPVSPSQDEERSEGFSAIVEGGSIKWVAPPAGQRVPTQCHETFKSMLDFIFVSGAARDWDASAEILFGEATYCEREGNGTSDHRPVKAVFKVGE